MKTFTNENGFAKLIETQYGFLVILHNGTKVRKNTTYNMLSNAEAAFADAVAWLGG